MTADSGFPQRIVCLTEETTETLYRLGEDWRIVGISGFTVRPPRARREKPRVSAFTSARTDRIVALQPDLVLGFSDLQADIAAELVRARAASLARRPRVYFEEWDDPMISGIQWVSELVTLAGGEECFPELAREGLGRNRIIADPLEVPRRAPDIVLGSWCGKKFQPQRLAARPGWDAIPAVRDGYVREIKSSLILQPGPAALTDGVRAIQGVIEEWAQRA